MRLFPNLQKIFCGPGTDQLRRSSFLGLWLTAARANDGSVADVTAEDIAEPLPAFALEPRQLYL
jgi:hypothetical protein